MTRGLRDFVLALSFLALTFAKLWGTVLNPGNFYFYRHPPHWLSFAIPAVATVAGALLLAAVAAVLRRSVSPLVRPAAAVVLWCGIALGLNGLRQQTPLQLSPLAAAIGWRTTWIMLGILGGASLWATLRFHRLTLRAAVSLLACFTPFAGLVLLQANYRMAMLGFRGARGFEDKPAAAQMPSPVQRRVVLLLFDMLDQNAIVQERTPGLVLPAFDAMRARSVHAENAYPVANSTAVSVPSLLTGRAVTKVSRDGSADLLLRFESGESASWSTASSLFGDVRHLGGNSALVGWYHPYCRVFGHQLASCEWHAYVPDPFGSPARVRRTLSRLLVETLPMFLLPQRDESPNAEWHAAQVRAVHARALSVVVDPRYSLIFVHYPVPHDPYIAIDRAATMPPSYDSNLVVADQLLAEVTRALETSESADTTALFVTSDHYWRRGAWRQRNEVQPEIGRPDHRIPLLLRLPGQESSAIVKQTLSHLIVHDLALEFLTGRVTTHAQAAAWMAEHELRRSAVARRGVAESRRGSIE